MTLKKVKVHKMFEDFHDYPKIQFNGEYDHKNTLVKLFDNLNRQLFRIIGTYQWRLIESNEIYFVEEDFIFNKKY